MVLVLTKPAAAVYAPTTAGGDPRGGDMGDALVYHTEIERIVSSLTVGNAGGFVSFMTKDEMDSSLNYSPGTLAFVSNDIVGENNWFYTKAGAPGAGRWVKASGNFLSDIAATAVTNDVTRTIPHPNFDFLADYGSVFACPGPGFARHNIDIATAWQKKFKLLTGSSGTNFPLPVAGPGDVFVDWNNGSDSGAGGINTPFKTVSYAIPRTSHTVWVLPGDSKEVIDAEYNNTRPVRVRALVPGTVRFIGRASKCEEMTWTGSIVYAATPSPAAAVDSITWMPSPGQYVPVPYNPAMNTGFFWYQDVSTKRISIRAFGKDFTSPDVKKEFIIAYIPAANHRLLGLNVLLEEINFVGTGQMTGSFDTAGTHRSQLFLKNCDFILTPNGNAIHSDGGLLVAQGCNIYGSGTDGFNYYQGNDAGNTACTFLEIDCTAKYCGWMHTTGGVPTARSHQGSSGHEGSHGIRINGDYGEGCYGQGIADTGASSYYWMVGTKVRDPYFNLYASIDDRYYSLWMEGKYWLDNVEAGGIGSLYGLWNQGGSGKQFNCDFRGKTAVGGSGTLVDYTPPAP